MKAMVLNSPGPIESAPLHWVDRPDATPKSGEVRLKVSCCAICRTDLHIIEGDLPRQKMPIIPGHQVVGVIDQLGPDCHRLALGQRVGIAWLRGTDGTCEYCRTGRENLCPATRFTGYHEDGGYAEYAVVPEDFAYEIPQAFSDIEAAPLLCAGIIGYRSLKRADPHPGCKLALYGFGSSAHIVMQIARSRGYETYVVTRGENHRELARQMGAVWVGEDASQMPVNVDSAIMFAPAGRLVPPALERLKPGGTLSLAGIYMSPIPTLDYEKHLFHERNLRSVTCNTRDDGRELFAEAARAPIRPHTKCYPLKDANRALDDLKHDRISGTGVLMIDQR
jgi:propanol-preferring alcohol dehydrogenase